MNHARLIYVVWFGQFVGRVNPRNSQQLRRLELAIAIYLESDRPLVVDTYKE
ncbi:MAG: hypothetical protein AB4426_08925 [Xenococcaceae cyanobacterium]